MARRRTKKSEAADASPRTSTKLEPAFSSSPSRNPRFELDCTNHETDRRYVVNTYALYAAQAIFHALVGENEYEVKPGLRQGWQTAQFGDIDISSPELDKIISYKPTSLEADWQLPKPYPEDIERFLHGPRMSTAIEHVERDTKGNLPMAKPVKPKIDRTGKITVQDIAAELKLLPRDARAILRKAKIAKPAGGWIGDDKWAEMIKATLKRGMKK